MWIAISILSIALGICSYYLIEYWYDNKLLKAKYNRTNENLIAVEAKNWNLEQKVKRLQALVNTAPKDNSKDLLKEIKELNIILDDKESHIISLDNDITHLRYILKNNKTNSNRSVKQQQHTKNKEESFYTKVIGIYKPYHFVEKEFLKDLEMLIKIKHLKS
jgi:phosphotransferase system IIB component